jgi:hypothetical protein
VAEKPYLRIHFPEELCSDCSSQFSIIVTK